MERAFLSNFRKASPTIAVSFYVNMTRNDDSIDHQSAFRNSFIFASIVQSEIVTGNLQNWQQVEESKHMSLRLKTASSRHVPAQPTQLSFLRNPHPPSPQIQLLKKIVPLVVDYDDEGGEVLDSDAPDRFHTRYSKVRHSGFSMRSWARPRGGGGAREMVTGGLDSRRPLPRVSLERIG